MSRQLWRNLMIAVLLALIPSCGGKTQSQNVLLTVFPSQPIVFTGAMTLPNGTQVTPPWFSFSLGVNNTTTGTTNDNYSSVTLIGVHVIVTGASSAGGMFTQTFDFTPAQDDQTNANFQCNYVDFGQFDRGGLPLAQLLLTNTVGKFPLAGVNNDKLFSLPDLQDGSCPIEGSVFYVGGLPTPPGGSFTYTVEVQPLGWFGTRAVQKERFQNQVYVTTQ